MIAGWIGFLTGFGAVLQAGRDVGISPWWAGPESDPRGPLILVAPFILGLITLILAIRNHRLACWVGLAASIVAMAIAVKDGNRYLGLGQAQMVIAVAGLIVTIAAMSGRMRKAASQ